MTTWNLGLGALGLVKSAREFAENLPRLYQRSLLPTVTRDEVAEALDQEVFSGSATLDWE